jgi:hypothetical protein
MEKQYWVQHEGKLTGTFSRGQLKRMAATGKAHCHHSRRLYANSDSRIAGGKFMKATLTRPSFSMIIQMAAVLLLFSGCEALKESNLPKPTLLKYKSDRVRPWRANDAVSILVRNTGGDGIIVVGVSDLRPGKQKDYRVERHFRKNEEAWVAIELKGRTLDRFSMDAWAKGHRYRSHSRDGGIVPTE